MNIAQRLLMLIVVGVLGLLATAGWSLYQMSTMNSATQYINQNILPSVSAASTIEARFLRYRLRVLYLLTSPESEREEHLKLMAEHRKVMESLIQTYEQSLISDDKDRQYLEATKRLSQSYFSEVGKVQELLKAGPLEDQKHSTKDLIRLARELTNNIEAHVKYNEELAKQQEGLAEAAYSSGKMLSFVLILLVGGMTVGLGLMIRQQVASSLNKMQETMDTVSSRLDFTQRVPAEGNDEVSQTMRAFNHLLERLQTSFREIRSHTAEVNSAAARVASAARQMSSASSYQSEAASGMAATVEQMTVSINHVAERAEDANRLSSSSGGLAQSGGQVIAATVAGINGIANTVQAASGHIARLEQSSERISAVVSVIKEVADQTNLLALNAAIEAARAGEQGRGFAVVADEVRKLAERTTHSTHEIAQTISEMQSGAQAAVEGIQAVVERVHEGVSSAERANQSIHEIGDSASRTQGMVADISDAIREQGSASTSIAQQVEKIAQMSEENSAAAVSTADTAEELARLAHAMQQVVDQYRL